MNEPIQSKESMELTALEFFYAGYIIGKKLRHPQKNVYVFPNRGASHFVNLLIHAVAGVDYDIMTQADFPKVEDAGRKLSALGIAIDHRCPSTEKDYVAAYLGSRAGASLPLNIAQVVIILNEAKRLDWQFLANEIGVALDVLGDGFPQTYVPSLNL